MQKSGALLPRFVHSFWWFSLVFQGSGVVCFSLKGTFFTPSESLIRRGYAQKSACRHDSFAPCSKERLAWRKIGAKIELEKLICLRSCYHTTRDTCVLYNDALRSCLGRYLWSSNGNFLGRSGALVSFMAFLCVSSLRRPADMDVAHRYRVSVAILA